MQERIGSKEYSQFEFQDKTGNVTVNATVNLTLWLSKVQPFNYSRSKNEISFIAPELAEQAGEQGATGTSVTLIANDGAASRQANVLTYTETVRSLPHSRRIGCVERRALVRLFWLCSALGRAIGGWERTADPARR